MLADDSVVKPSDPLTHIVCAGELHVPLEVCGAVVKRELDFWQIDEMEIKACCWRHYRSYIENQAILDSFNNSLVKQCRNINIDHLRGWRKLQMQIWLILDHPRTSKVAMVSLRPGYLASGTRSVPVAVSP